MKSAQKRSLPSASYRQEGVPPDEYVIAPTLQFFCTGCGACTDACPKDAITLTPNTPSA